MNKQDVSKLQTCVLKVNVDCKGCKDRVEKKLKKIKGVHSVKADIEQGRVTVTGNVDPAILVKKLSEISKHAEILGGDGKKGQKEGKEDKGGNEGNQQQQQQQQAAAQANHQMNQQQQQQQEAAAFGGSDYYTHMFSDENANSCSVM